MFKYKSECGWLLDASTMGSTIGYLQVLTSMGDFPPYLLKDVQKTIEDLKAVKCKHYRED